MECASDFVDMNEDEMEEVEFAEDENVLSTAPAPIAVASIPPMPQQQQPQQQQQQPQVPQPQSLHMRPQMQQRRVKRVRKANTNVVSVKLDTLTEDVVVATGDPAFCEKCSAAFSQLDCPPKEQEGEDKGKEKEEEEMEVQKTWTCKFCEHVNPLNLDEEELPRAESVDYILEPPNEKAEAVASKDSVMVIFCIDISGSMCVSTEIAGKHELRGSESVKRLASLNTERADQWAPRERHDVTYVSRLQSVKAAIDAQLEKMEHEQPNRKVGLVTFNNEVTVVGDGTKTPETITGDKLHNFDQLVNLGRAHMITGSIKETRSALTEKLFALEETGPTALGPALVVSAGIAGEVPGSEIVLCTDGLSNVGLGKLDELYTEEDRKGMQDFYRSVGEYAVSHGTTISVISIKGEDCSIENLGVLIEMTNGAVNIVDPLKITQEFSGILSSPAIATHVSVKLVMHNGLFIRSDVGNEEEQVEKQSFVTREVGNVTTESAFTFEYGVKKADEVKNKNLKALPFQLQISYTKLNGMKCIRIITREQKVTWDKSEAEADVNVNVLGLNALQQTAQIAQQGHYSYARLNNYSHLNMLQRVAKSSKQQEAMSAWAVRGADFEENMRHEQKQELQEGLLLDDEDDVDVRDRDRSRDRDRDRDRDRERAEVRRNRRGDGMSNMLYNMKKKTPGRK